MDINVGDYLQKTIIKTYTTNDGEEKTEERTEYYFVLSVVERNIEIKENRVKNAPYWGSPMPDAVVHDYEDVEQEYFVKIIPFNDMEREEIYESYRHNGIDCQRSIGYKLKWHGKELYTKYSDVYYNGREFVHSPVGFMGDKKGI